MSAWHRIAAVTALLASVACHASSPRGDRDGSEGAAPVTGARIAPQRGSSFPLQQWMKANASPALASGSSTALEGAFRRMGELGMPDYPEWKRFAEEGADAARRSDLDRVKATCKSCHDAYRSGYRAHHRSRALP